MVILSNAKDLLFQAFGGRNDEIPREVLRVAQDKLGMTDMVWSVLHSVNELLSAYKDGRCG